MLRLESGPPDSLALPSEAYSHLSPSGDPTLAYDQRAIVRQALRELEARPATSLAAVAQRCGVSSHTLVRAVARCGMGSAAALRDRCIRRAMQTLMVAVPSKSIKEISDELGFARPSNFARWTRRSVGASPTAIRQSLGICPIPSTGQSVEGDTLT